MSRAVSHDDLEAALILANDAVRLLGSGAPWFGWDSTSGYSISRQEGCLPTWHGPRRATPGEALADLPEAISPVLKECSEVLTCPLQGINQWYWLKLDAARKLLDLLNTIQT